MAMRLLATTFQEQWTNDEIVLIVDGSEEIFDTFDLEEATFTRASGKKLLITSPMPENFPLLLSVSDMSNFALFLKHAHGLDCGSSTRNNR